MLALFEIGVEAKVAFDLFLDAGDMFGLGQLEDGLGVVGHRAIAIDGDIHRPHAQEAERHQAEGEDGGIMGLLAERAPTPCRLTK